MTSVMENNTSTCNLDYKVIATGSTGNAVRIGSIMIDCGIPYSKMKEELYKVDTLLITHTHTDHIKKSTIMSITKDFPRIKIYGNYDVCYKYPFVTPIGNKPFVLKNKTKVYPTEGIHDVPVTYYSLEIPVSKKEKIYVFYATDTAEVINKWKFKYDYVFCESNYDEQKIMTIGKKYVSGRYDPRESIYRHLSTQQCKAFYYINRKDKNSPLIPLHMSKRFY